MEQEKERLWAKKDFEAQRKMSGLCCVEPKNLPRMSGPFHSVFVAIFC